MQDVAVLEREREKLKEQLQAQTWGVHKIRDDNKAVRFYTGLQSFATFMWLFK